ncbi:MAG: threonine synthase [Spirochaetes bacterium GWB1_27_13]|nr:MAG: threonine synthase [Spirochaetes bacterium GWB1_27_13]
MEYYSTEKKSPNVSFKEAIIKGLSPDRGLYMPNQIGKFNNKVFEAKTFYETAFEVAKILLDGAINDNDLYEIVKDSFNFPVPVKNVQGNIYVMELFCGPTAAFKDFGARFMARVLSYYLKQSNSKLTILVATSGDTGSAVAKGFYKVPNIDVVILYPKGKVSFLQEKQLTTLYENITALEVNGTFDDCQYMVKEAFVDDELNKKLTLSSANSINIGRLYPQSFYYVWAYKELKKITGAEKIICCTPSGNFGNLTGGLLAKKMGLPIEKFIAATNINDVVPEYLNTGIFNPRPSVETYSNAMDVGNPSNFARMLALYGSKEEMQKDIIGYKVTNDQTVKTIQKVYKDYGYILDPHGAVGYHSIEQFLAENKTDLPIVFLETAHPAKFGDVIKDAINIDVPVPEILQDALIKEKKSIEIDNHYNTLKEFLLNRKSI